MDREPLAIQLSPQNAEGVTRIDLRGVDGTVVSAWVSREELFRLSFESARIIADAYAPQRSFLDRAVENAQRMLCGTVAVHSAETRG